MRRKSICIRGFTLVELMVVIGLISLLISLLFPVTTKIRSAANSVTCMSNLRQLGLAWTMYVSENKGKLPPYIWQTLTTPDLSWNGYWPGIVETKGGVKGRALICPQANTISANSKIKGYGNATTAWTGRYTASATPVNFNPLTYRDSSYGFNRSMTAMNGYGQQGLATNLVSVGDLTTAPLFFDCAFADVKPQNGTPQIPVESPPNLTGSAISLTTPDHWKFLLARHGRGINVCTADGSVKWYSPEDAFMLRWLTNWKKYRLDLPAK